MDFNIKPYTNYDEKEIFALYESVGWTNYLQDPSMLPQSFSRSLIVLGAYAEEWLAGILRAVGDGVSILYIQDILVFPSHQRQGIGSALLKELLSRYPHVYQKMLLTDDRPETKAFYKAMGFKEVSEMGCSAFVQFKK
jgi:GNAT superfamily N-acetyltransferase